MRTALIAALLLVSWPAQGAQPNPGWDPYSVCREAEGETVGEDAPDEARAAALNTCMAAMKDGWSDAACDREVVKLPADYRALGDYLCKSAVLISSQ